MSTENTNPPSSSNHIVSITLLLAVAIGATWFLTKKNGDERVIAAINSTITAEQTKYGISTQSKGNVVDYAEIEKRLRASMGKELLAEIKKTNSSISTVNTAVGIIEGGVRDLKRGATLIELPKTPDGSFTGVSLVQNRGPFPPLTTVNLDFKNNKLSGKWINNTTELIISNAVWHTDDSGMRAAITAKMITYLGTDKTIKLGEEEVPITQNNLYVSLPELRKLAPFPKWTITLDAVINLKDGKKGYDFNTTKWLTRKWGLNTGYTTVGPEKLIKFGTSVNLGNQ